MPDYFPPPGKAIINTETSHEGGERILGFSVHPHFPLDIRTQETLMRIADFYHNCADDLEVRGHDPEAFRAIGQELDQILLYTGNSSFH